MTQKQKAITFLMTLVGALAPATVVFAAPAKGSCEETAELISFGTAEKAVTVNLVPAWIPDENNPEGGTYDVTNRVYFYKATLSRGKAYSVWLEGTADGSKEIDFYMIDPRPAEGDDEFEPGATFDEFSGGWCSAKKFDARSLQVMTAESWTIDPDDPEMSDPPSWVYYFHLSGAEGETAKLHFIQANALPRGIEENPVLFTVSALPAGGVTAEETFVDGEYAFSYTSELLNGRRYQFATVGGTPEIPYFLGFGAGKVTDCPDWASAGNASVYFDPATDGEQGVTLSFTNVVEGMTMPKLRLRHRILPARALAQHPATTLAVGTPSEPFLPGHMNATDNAYYDTIVDEQLFKFRAEKGTEYLVEATGSTTNLLMVLYDATGRKLSESRTAGDGSLDVRLGFAAAFANDYYIGVCQDLEDDDADPVDAANGQVRVTVTPHTTVEGSPDVSDPADDTWAGATTIKPVMALNGTNARWDDAVGSDLHALDRHDWYDTFAIPARKGLSYAIAISLDDPEAEEGRPVYGRVYTVKGKTEASVGTATFNAAANSGMVFKAKEDAVHYLRISTPLLGLDYPKYRIHCSVFSTETPEGAETPPLATLELKQKGLPGATCLVGGAVYPTDISLVVSTNGTTSVKFAADKNFNVVPGAVLNLKLSAGETREILGVYSDKADPKDDQETGATSWTLKNTMASFARTLWTNDPADHFAIAGKDGQYYTFGLSQKLGEDAVFSIVNAEQGVLAQGVTKVEKLLLPTSKYKYYLKVEHKDGKKPLDTSYAIDGFLANVGTFKFAKSAVSAKENAGSVTLTVNRSAKDGAVRVAYATADGTAVAGQDYYAQSGVLEWADGDNKAKTITIRLIPDIVPLYRSTPRRFTVKLADGKGEYPAVFAKDGDDLAVVTLAETAKATQTQVKDAYKPIAAKSVKSEDVPVYSGSFFGVVAAEKNALTNGLPALASVTLTSTSKSGKEALTAKVALAGKSYGFKTDAKNAEPWTDLGDGRRTVTMTLEQKVANVPYANTLKVTANEMATSDPGAWATSDVDLELVMNVPDANNKGVQKDIRYTGSAYRNNAKVDDYLKAVVDFVGYYTVALESRDRATGKVVEAGDLPAGNGYLTLTVDNGGKMKVAGKLADGTAVSVASLAAALREDASSANGYVLSVPLFAAKSPYVFGGTLVLTATEALNGDGRHTVVVDTAASDLVWNNDSLLLSKAGDKSLAYDVSAIGGFYDTVERLQRHYFDRGLDTFAVDTVAVSEMPEQLFTIGSQTYAERVAEQQADGYAVALSVDALSTDKKVIVKAADKKSTDFAASQNPANVQVKIARATGLVTGSFSVWAAGTDAKGNAVQKEITGAKHFGVLLMAADELPEGSAIAPETLTAGFFNQSVTVPSGTKTRKWNYAAPFNINGKASE